MPLYHLHCNGQIIQRPYQQPLLGGIELPATLTICNRCGSTSPIMYESNRPLDELALMLSRLRPQHPQAAEFLDQEY
jgi:hypothetical protein